MDHTEGNYCKDAVVDAAAAAIHEVNAATIRTNAPAAAAGVRLQTFQFATNKIMEKLI